MKEDSSLIVQVDDWLDEQALTETNIVALFEGLCARLYAIGVPIARANLMWSTLHPLFLAESVMWKRGAGAVPGQFIHQDERTDAWMRSPMHHLLEVNVRAMRRRLTGPERLLDFEILKELAEQGYTDYLILGTDLFTRAIHRDDQRRGMFVTWATDRPDGFSESELRSLQRIQRRLAVACKMMIQAQISRNISDAYLGHLTGERVLNGLIRLGDGEETRALVWYSDLRSSTRLAETMPSAEFLKLLNVYFECAARPVIEAGGEVLAFVGDAVLAIFPFADEDGLPDLAKRAVAALRKSLEMGDAVNAERVQEGLDPICFGVGLNVGSVMYGNIGVPERLAFSAVGPTVIEVARIEKLTKRLGARGLATPEIASFEPHLWRSLGSHPLEGVGKPQELFGFRETETPAEAKAA